MPLHALYESIYPEVDVLVHFAEWEGITIAPREAMAHGVVPVISRFRGSGLEREFIHEVNALTFAVADVESAAASIQRLHHDRQLLRRLSDAAKESQTGIRSEEGALDAWAAALGRAAALPQRLGSVLPPIRRDSGRLDWLPASLAEIVRRRRPIPHTEPGGEWPHWSGRADTKLSDDLDRLAAETDRAAESST
jgi:hypothetical protein